MDRYAWVTLATNDAYSLGALVLAHSLRRVGTKYELVCMVTPGVTTTMREKLAAVFSLVQEVNVLDSKDEANLALLARPELGITFTKLHCWRLTQYAKCVFVDADALVIRNCDELFEREELSAAPDVGWPDCFNSGVFVYKPSQQTFASIISFAAAKGSFDGGDQGLLNMYFSDWATKDISKHLPFIYNMCSTATYSYLPAFKQFGEDVRIIHFIGITKPWLQYFDTLTGLVQPPAGSEHLQPLLQLWWNIFCERVHPQLTTTMAGIAGALAQLTLGAARSKQQIVLEEQMRKQSWEQGHIDYMGQDSFDNIWKKICETLSQAQQRQASPLKEDKPKDEGSSILITPTVQPAAIVEQKTPAAETDKDSTQEQSLTCKLSEEKLPAPVIPTETRDENVIVAQPSEQKTPALAAEESVTVEAAAVKPVQSVPEDVCMKPSTQESQDVKPCKTCTEVSSPKPPVELPPLAETTAEQCKLVSPTTQEATSQDKSESVQLPAEATPPAKPQACLLTSAVCKPPVLEVVAPVVQTETAPTPAPVPASAPVPAPADDKPQLPTPTTPETMQLAATPDTTQPIAIPIGADTPQDITGSAVAPSETSILEIGKPIIGCTTDVTQPLTIDPSERHAEMLLAASEISTVSPVPIQVAESVLQAEPKESVSGTAAAVSDQAIATTVTAVTDVAPTIATEPKEQAVQLNGLSCDSGKRDDVAAAAPSPPEKTDAAVVAEPTKEPASDSVTVKDVPAEAQPVVEGKAEPISSVIAAEMPAGKVEEEAVKPAEQVPVATGTTEAAPTAQITTSEAKETKPAEVKETKPAEAKETKPAETKETKPAEAKETKPAEQQVTKTEATEAKPAEQVAKVEPAEEKPKEASEQPTKIETTKAIAQPEVKIAKPEVAEAKPTESTEQAIKAEAPAAVATAKRPGEVPKLPMAETPQQPPAEPVEAKIPSTPTVIEATPPTSPSVESAQETAEGQEKAAKKSLKKSDSADGTDGESADKKAAKKTVKKVTKKPKPPKSEEAASAAPEAAPAATPVAAAATATAAAAATGDNSQSKTKKTVKVMKKTGAKSGQSLEADTTVPETPPPPTTTTSAAATPDAPVPPKRKTKTSPPSVKGTAGKKSEAEE